MNPELANIAALPGVLQIAIADDSGRLIDFAGECEPPTAAVLVLAHATLSAASELGRRSGSGDCLEVLQQHEGGCIFLHGLPQCRLVLVRCVHTDAVPAVRARCQRLIMAEEPVRHPPAQAFMDIADALHAEPEW